MKVILLRLLSILLLMLLFTCSGCGPTYMPRGEQECKQYCRDRGNLDGLYMGEYCSCINRHIGDIEQYRLEDCHD